MGTYGPHFDFTQPPRPEDRLGRYFASTELLIGAPVKTTGVQDDNGRTGLVLCTAPVAPVKTKHGIMVYEYPYSEILELGALARPRDVPTAPAAAPVQLCSGSYVRARYNNLAADDFHGHVYGQRIMVAGVSIATPTVAQGDMLTPGPGSDSGGYWTETSDASLAWLIVTGVDTEVGFVEVQMRF